MRLPCLTLCTSDVLANDVLPLRLGLPLTIRRPLMHESHHIAVAHCVRLDELYRLFIVFRIIVFGQAWYVLEDSKTGNRFLQDWKMKSALWALLM